MTDDGLYLLHIAEAIRRIEEYTAGGCEAFWSNTLTQDGVLYNLRTLAESTKRLSEKAKGKRPEVDWKSIVGLRNVLVHDYLGLDLDEIWEIVTLDIPVLKAAVEALSAEAGLSPPPAAKEG